MTQGRSPVRTRLLGPWVVPLLIATHDGASVPAPKADEGNTAGLESVELPVRPCGGAVEHMACVPGGWTWRGDNDLPAASPREQVWLQTFFIDLYEVTNADYRRCADAGACANAGPRYADFDADNQPINGVSWYDADTFCRAAGKQLPSEAQWEKAARGPDGWRYPWGDERATCRRAIMADASGRGCGVQKRGARPETGKPWPVGSRAAGIYGIFDMAGNAYEWVADWAASSYAACGDDCRGVDPRGPCAGMDKCEGHRRKVVRGGSWYWGYERALSFHRRMHVPRNEPFHHFGFRCAASVDTARSLAR